MILTCKQPTKMQASSSNHVETLDSLAIYEQINKILQNADAATIATVMSALALILFRTM